MDFYYKFAPFNTTVITGYKGKDKHVKFPLELKINVIGDGIFKNNTTIESVEIPDTVRQLGGFVFDGCTSLKSITLPPELEDMWQYALTRTSFEEIEIPGTVKTIVPFTFNESKLLKKVIFNEGTKEICGNAFKDCVSLEEIHVPSSLTKISEKAFEGCGDVKIVRK